LKTSIPYIAWVTNAEPATGGTEPETLDAALLRGPQTLRTSTRAVTAEDYERLAAEATPDVVRARCVYAREGSDALAGNVRLVLVPKMKTTNAPVPIEQLALSDQVRTTVQDYLDARRMITVRMILESPTYLPVSVRTEVFAMRGSNRDELKPIVEEALYRFIHPAVGGTDGDGWPFDRPLYVSDLYGLMQSIDTVDHVGTVHLVQMDRDGNEHPVTADSLSLPALTLFCSAPHRVTIK
jgi:predicted phage baseplate assembly protein